MMKLFLCLENLISLSPIYWLSRINSCGWVRFIAPEGSQLDIFRSSLLSFEHFWFLTRRVGEICTLLMAVCYWTDRYIHILIFSFLHLRCTKLSQQTQAMDGLDSLSITHQRQSYKVFRNTAGLDDRRKGTSSSTTTVRILKCEKFIFKKWNWCVLLIAIDHFFTSTSGILVLAQDIRPLQHLRTASLKKGDQSHSITIKCTRQVGQFCFWFQQSFLNLLKEDSILLSFYLA